MKRGEWHDGARLVHAQHPEMTNGEIAALFGVTNSAVWKVLNPEPTRQWVAQDNKRRQGAKNAWQSRRNRDPDVRGRCSNVVCGRLLGIGHSNRPEMCQGCWDALAEVRRSLAEGMWAADWTVRELGEVFEVGKDRMGALIATWRNRGHAERFPHRRTPEQVARITAGWARVRAAA